MLTRYTTNKEILTAMCAVSMWNLNCSGFFPLYSLDGKDAVILESTLSMRCEVHRFDPSTRRKHGSGSGYGSVQHHQAWLDWRRPHTRPHRGVLGTIPRRLVDIMDSLGHSMVLSHISFLIFILMAAQNPLADALSPWRCLWSRMATMATVSGDSHRDVMPSENICAYCC